MRFYRWFLESFKSCLLLLVALSGLTDTLAQLLAWLSLLWLSVMWRRRYLTHNHFLRTISLAWSLALHLLFCSAEVFAVEGNKHTHTHKHTNRHIYVLSTRDVFLVFNTPINTYRYPFLLWLLWITFSIIKFTFAFTWNVLIFLFQLFFLSCWILLEIYIFCFIWEHIFHQTDHQKYCNFHLICLA